MNMRNAATCACFFVAALLQAQDKPAFEVASIRPVPPGDGAFSFDIARSGRLSARNMTVWNLAREAWGWRDSQITGGPSWIKTDGFDIEANPVSDAPVDRLLVLKMLRSLLEERFQFRWHEQVRESAGYALRVAPGGPRLMPSKEGPERLRRGDLSSPGITMESLCQIFEFDLAKPVVDQTDLPGKYAVELQWARESPADAAEPDTSKPSLFTAVREQLGLRLESAKLPVRTFTIDDVQRPSGN